MKRAMFCAYMIALPWAFPGVSWGADQSPGGAEPLPPPLAVAPDTANAGTEPAPPPAKPTPPPYSLPWQLRPAAAVNVVRSDTSTGFRSVNGVGGTTVATLLLGSYKVTPDLALVVRAGFVDDAAPGKPSASAFLNPALGATYVVQARQWVSTRAVLGCRPSARKRWGKHTGPQRSGSAWRGHPHPSLDGQRSFRSQLPHALSRD